MEHKLLQFFAFGHLPKHLQAISEPYHALAEQLCKALPHNHQLDKALEKLLESKDCAVRSALMV